MAVIRKPPKLGSKLQLGWFKFTFSGCAVITDPKKLQGAFRNGEKILSPGLERYAMIDFE
jgi:hypothetical protein